MKGKISALLFGLLVLSLASCKTKQPETKTANTTTTTTTTTTTPNSLPIATCPALSKGVPSHNDAIAEMDATIKQNCLLLKMRYSGGCEEHYFDLYWDGNWAKSKPAVVKLNLSHNANGDNCESIEAQVVQFDLLKVRSNLGGQVIVEVNANGVPMKRLNYTY